MLDGHGRRIYGHLLLHGLLFNNGQIVFITDIGMNLHPQLFAPLIQAMVV